MSLYNLENINYNKKYEGILEMQIVIKHKIDSPLVLPINYNYILQSALYDAMKGRTNINDFIHDSGFENNNRTFKMFTFSMLRGKYRIEDKKIIFYEDVSFEVRSKESVILRNIKESLERNGITYINQHYDVQNINVYDYEVEAEEMMIRMRTPICVHETYMEEGTSKTRYYSPWDDEFEKRINENFRNKYESYTMNKPESSISIEPVQVNAKDKLVTKYKGIYISAWKGEYRLKGERKYLDFLYQVGLGEKNAQGFGMFDVT